MPPPLTAADVAALVRTVPPADALLEEHRAAALTWLASTDDIWRRARPSTPDPHLVAYAVPLAPDGAVLLGAHRRSGLWLPPGGHVDAGERPMAAACREAREELGVDLDPAPPWGDTPAFLTVTRTVGAEHTQHTDVTLWCALAARRDLPYVRDDRELAELRWWSADDVRAAPAGTTEPHLARVLAARVVTR